MHYTFTFPKPIHHDYSPANSFGVCVAFFTSVSPASAADSLTVTLQVSNYNGYQVSCFGMKDGWIDLTVNGGEGPYFFKWSNGSSEEDLSGLAAGYYKVDVFDQAEQMVTLG